MVTLDLQVGAAADDAHEADDGTSFSRTNTAVFTDSNTVAGNRYNGGFRFTGVTIQGTTIDVAYLTVYVPSVFADDVNVDILAEDVDNAVSFLTNEDVTSRVRTTASVQWTANNLGTGEKNSPSIVSVAQELADRAGFANSAAVFLMDGKSDVNRSLSIRSYDGSSINAAKFHIEYTAGGATAKFGGGSGAALVGKPKTI